MSPHYQLSQVLGLLITASSFHYQARHELMIGFNSPNLLTAHIAYSTSRPFNDI